jgi:uncharacterized membrane protein
MIETFVLFAIAAAFAWGGSNLFDKAALKFLPSTSVLAIKGVCVAIVSIAVYLVSVFVLNTGKRSPRTENPRNWPSRGILFAAGSATLSSMGSLLFLKSLDRCTDVHIVAAIACTTPMTTIVLSKIFMKNVRITLKQILAIALIVTGVIIVSMCGEN